ncbi:NAD(P)/FAD-dependent oxidoreductase [Phytohabitans rumicis]|uniref:Pyridine nucleotide-disulfide oxidoreductase n=1 Tax=Phytohabitans rumicis TaxID=1076125 RepID=A0A6V8LMH2_9ACTN|nr:FAD/NAD(P)-binding oxidoreductase [Phytohabitans rumicis]GFJ96211.1 pyridine nucleotide-disulfide oxidoreductase [Phytohabitans rumicis]
MAFVIVGAGLAGAKAAQTLREEGFDGDVTLIGTEPERPYERPPLSKGVLLGDAERDSVYVHPADWYAAHDIDLRAGTTVTGIDRARRRVHLEDGESLVYDRLLLATGSAPRHLPVPGADLDGVLYLRTLADIDRVAAAAVDGARLVIVGAGWIGLEVAAAARHRGAAVTVVEAADLPLQQVLGTQIAGVFADLHREHDVRFHFGVQVERLNGTGHVTSVRLTDGTDLPADAVLVAVGARPLTDLAEAAGLSVDNGVTVDASLRTSDPHVYAAGDVANLLHPLLGERIRVEHWSNALHSGPAAARAMLGQDVRYDRLPYFFTDQYDLGMEYRGWAPRGTYDQVVIRGDGDKREFLAFWLRDSRVLAAMNVNIWDANDHLDALVRAGLSGTPANPNLLP